ncbi:MAG: hypothetical protein HDR95_01040 [Bacteroides sp.]|nr:hypothetical protein [Bacteroidales bacterium]MBD5335885.1 hypothetical protein [Bacteroides sp.]
MLEGTISAKFANKFFEKDVFKVIKRRAALASLIMMLPDFGLGGIFYVIILWNMYKKVSEKVGISFSEHKKKLIGVGLLVNIAVAVILDIALSALFFIEPFIIYAQFYLSGKMFVESLKKLN